MIQKLLIVTFLVLILGTIGCANKTNCEEIANVNERDNCYVESITERSSLSVCENIEGAAFKEECVRLVAVNKQSLDVCDTIEDVKTRSNCYAHVAESKKDATLCKSVEDYDWEQICFNKVARATNDPDVCDKIDDRDNENICYTDVALALDDPSICKNIGNIVATKNDCFTQVALENLNEEGCMELVVQSNADALNKDLCFKNLARLKEDVAVCQFITSDMLRAECLTS